jgi:hypothetical protein
MCACVLSVSTLCCAAWAEEKPDPKSPPAPTQWVEQATDVIDTDFPRFDQLPKHLSINSLTICNLDFVDTRDKLGIYVKSGLLAVGSGNAMPQLGKS